MVYWIDNHAPIGGSPADNVDGTIALTVQSVKASGVLEPTGSGNFEITTPTVTIGTITN